MAAVNLDRAYASRCSDIRRRGAAATTHFGIRYANDPTDEFSEYIVDSVDLLNLQLAPHGVGFFFDAVDVGLPEGPLSRGARQRRDRAIRGGAGINSGVQRGCLSCGSGEPSR